MIEKYYICPNCGELTTETEILFDCEMGGTGCCDCEYITYYWNDEINNLDISTDRTYFEYVEIHKFWFYELKGLSNDVTRLQAFKQIPIKRRLKYGKRKKY